MSIVYFRTNSDGTIVSNPPNLASPFRPAPNPILWVERLEGSWSWRCLFNREFRGMSPLRWARLCFWITGNMRDRLVTDDLLRTASGGMIVTLRVLSVEDFLRWPDRYLLNGPPHDGNGRDRSPLRPHARLGRQLSITRVAGNSEE